LRRFVVYLATFADPDGTNIFPSVDRVAKHMHVTRRTVFNLYRKAEQAKMIIREGHTRGGMIRSRLNLELPCAEGWLPYDAAAEHRREKQREYTKAWRERKARGETKPLTMAEGGEKKSLTDASGEGDRFTQPSLSDHQEDHLQIPTAVAAATPVEEIIEAELIEPEPATPAAELAVRASMLPNLSDSWLLPETPKKGAKPPTDAQLFDASRWPAPAEARQPSQWVRLLMDRWSAACIDGNGMNPSKAQFGQAGREIRALVHAGNNPNHIAMACDRAASRGTAMVARMMQDVNPVASWSNARPGRQIVTPQGVEQLPQGVGAAEARYLSIMAHARG
jgi:hypothetical protein